jgi:hypothetical protein
MNVAGPITNIDGCGQTVPDKTRLITGDRAEDTGRRDKGLRLARCEGPGVYLLATAFYGSWCS